jgi:hypothetical protein
LAGRVTPSRLDPFSLEEWEPFDLARWEAFDIHGWQAVHFFAWAIDRFGIDVVLDAHVATSRVAEEEVGAVVAQTLSFDSVAELHAEYEATSAFYYPMLPATTKAFTAEELASGGVLDISCEGPYAEGPGAKYFGQIEPDMAITVARIEILEAGEYQVFIGPLGDNSSTWEPTELYDEPLAWKEERQGRRCSGSPPPFPMHFPTPGQYEIHVGVPINEARQTEVAVRDIGSDECPPP